MENITMYHGSVVHKPESFVYYIYGAYITIIGLLGTAENGCVVLVFVRSKILWTPSNVFIFDLACSDFLICAIGFPFLMLSSFYGTWIFDKPGCYAYAFSMSITGMHSIFVLFVVAIERYYAIFYPLQTIKSRTIQRSTFIVILTWVLAILISIPPLLGWNRYVLEGLQISCSYDMFDVSWKHRSYITLLIGTFVVVLSSIIFCYVKVLFQVRKQAAEMRIAYTQSFNRFQLAKEHNVEKKLIYVGIHVTIAFVLSWGPYALVTILAIFNILSEENSMFIVAIPAYFAKSFTIYNPIIYIFNYPTFKKEFFKLLDVLKKVICINKATTRTHQQPYSIDHSLPSIVNS